MLPPAFRYGTPDQWTDFWRQVGQERPRFVVLTPWPSPDRAHPEAVAAFVRELPPGYHLGAHLTSSMWGSTTWPTWIYELD
jgi:hypothetical protein